jgi:hypothetical protein
MRRYRVVIAAAVFGLLIGAISVSNASATLLGTPLLPNDSGIIPLDVTGTPPGTLLASLLAPFSSTRFSGTIESAVYRETSGMLDFYYQVMNSANSIDPIARETDSVFSGFSTSVAFRSDGASGVGNGFVNGGRAPTTADRNVNGSVVGFEFPPSLLTEIDPGLHSDVLVISTNATNFAAGNASVIDGTTFTAASFQPASAVPEPGSMLLLGSGLMSLVAMRRVRR